MCSLQLLIINCQVEMFVATFRFVAMTMLLREASMGWVYVCVSHLGYTSISNLSNYLSSYPCARIYIYRYIYTVMWKMVTLFEGNRRWKDCWFYDRQSGFTRSRLNTPPHLMFFFSLFLNHCLRCRYSMKAWQSQGNACGPWKALGEFRPLLNI